MDQSEFADALLGVMEQKLHWAWPAFTSGMVRAAKLHIHLEQEYEVYVRDFPVLVAWAYVRCPIPAVRRDLIENVYEEETGGLIAGRPHPELFLEYPHGLGMDLARFEAVTLLPGAAAFRSYLDAVTQQGSWTEAASLTTLFLEGTAHDRHVLDSSAPARPEPLLSEHPLVLHYGLPLDCLELTKAHRRVEGDHRRAAWRVVLDHVPAEERRRVVAAMRRALELWQAYRDDVARACGLVRNAAGAPALAEP